MHENDENCTDVMRAAIGNVKKQDLTPQTRQYDLDWLRGFAILAVFIFHSCRFFDLEDWHVKSATMHASVQGWIMFLNSWLMPMMFLISGSSIFLTIGKSKTAAFIRDKVLRLLVPLVIGVFTHIALGVYLERITHHQYAGSFFSFYPHYFEGLYAFHGNFAWMGLHLWYLLVLFVLTVLFLPLFYLLNGRARGFLNGLGNFLSRPGAIFIILLPLALSAVYAPRVFGAWPTSTYLLFIFCGFIIFSHDRLQEQIRRSRFIYFAIAVAASAILVWRFGYILPPAGASSRWYFGICFLISSWCWILTFIGYARTYFRSNPRFLQYANEAVLPFYVMHQTVLLCVGYFVLQWDISDMAKWFIIAAVSFAAIMILYEFAVRRFNILRIAFGMHRL